MGKLKLFSNLGLKFAKFSWVWKVSEAFIEGWKVADTISEILESCELDIIEQYEQ